MSVTPSNATSASNTTRGFPWLGLIVLGAAVFLSVTGETMPTGLLPDMSESLGVSEPQVGLLVTVFALTVVVTSAPLTALTRRLPRHGLLIGVLILLGVANILTGIAPTYGLVVATRVLGGIAHGMFWVCVTAYTGHLVPKEQIGRAVSITLGGGMLAIVFGVPIATAAGHAFGWEASYAGLGMLTIVGAILVWALLPKVNTSGAAQEFTETGSLKAVTKLRHDPTILPVLIACSLAAIIMIGQYTFYTFIAPFMITVMGVGPDAVAPLLFLYGIAGAGGLALAGSVFGPRPQLGLVSCIIATGIGVAVLATLATAPVIGLAAFVLWGLGFGALPPLLQTRMLHASSAAFRDTAAALYTTAFNVGIGGGALVGSLLYGSIGVTGLPWVYVGVLAAALVIALVSARFGARLGSKARARRS